MAWRLLDHTADVGIEAHGDDAGEALGEAGIGLTAVLAGKDDVHAMGRPTHELAFEVEAPDHGALAVAFLSELVWLHDTRDLLWMGGGVQVEQMDDGLLRATARGNGVVRSDRGGVEVKAVTYHDLHSGPEGGRWRVRVILDI